MKLATTTRDFDRFCETYEEKIGHIANAGFKNIDMGIYTVSRNADLLENDNWMDRCKQILEFSGKLGVKLVQAHAPTGNPLLTGQRHDDLVKYTIRSIDVCGALGIPNIVVHAGWESGIGQDEWFEKNREFYAKLFDAMEKNNVNVLVENGTRVNLKDRDCYYLYTGADMKSFVKYVDHPLFHACWDTGHANAEGAQYDQIMAMGKDLYAIHFNDNLGKCDEHILPYCGTMNMDDIMHGLIDNGFGGYLTFEACNMLRPFVYNKGNRRDCPMEKRLSEPTLAMQDIVEKLLYEIGRHILTSYGIFEE